MKRLLALGALAVSLTSCLGVSGNAFSDFATIGSDCVITGEDRELLLSFDYFGGFDRLSFSVLPNGKTTPSVVDVSPNAKTSTGTPIGTPGFRRFGTDSNKYEMAINLQKFTSTPLAPAVQVTPQAVIVTIPEPEPKTLYPMDITLSIFNLGSKVSELTLKNVNVAKCYGK
jgi:hypothetical protein